MAAKEWIKTVSDTAEPFKFSAFDFLEGRSFDEVTFAGMDQSHVIDRAYVDPYDAKSAGLACYGGLSDYGTILPTFAYHLRVNRRANFVVAARRPLTQPILSKPDYIPGRWLYGGELMHHFGHFMAESSHRVYAITEYFKDHADTADGIVFSSRMGLKGFARDLFCEYYGIPEDKIRLVREKAAVVEHLEIRPQGSIIGGSALTSEYADFLDFYQESNSKRIAKVFPRKLFFGRAHLTTGGGGIEDEHQLEHLVKDHGYTVVRPEDFPLLEQLEMLRQAESIVGIGGSFVHLYDHLGRTDASMFLVSRGDPDSFYHDRTAISKVASLDYYQPSAEHGDTGSESLVDGRSRYAMRYNMERLLDATNTFMKAH